MWKHIKVDRTSLVCYDNGDIWRQDKRCTEEIWKKFVSKSKGYWLICINGKYYLNSRVITSAFLGFDLKSKLFIDHINHNIHDNSIDNLRVVTQQQNAFNIQNVKGYYKRFYTKVNGTVVESFIIQLGINGKQISKSVKTEEEARQGYLELKRIHHII
jgi:hypothetical protein